MDASALVVIAVSGAVGGAALWIGAGWLQQAARDAARASRRARLAAISAQTGPAPVPRPRPRPAGAPPAVAPVEPVLPVLQDSIPMTSGAETTTGWPSTNFPATQPMSLADLNTQYADTMPAPLPER
jgi:hypothetical protein